MAHQELERHYLLAQLRVKQRFRFTQFQVLSLLKCLLVLARPVFVICLRKQKLTHQQLSLSMKLMQLGANVALD